MKSMMTHTTVMSGAKAAVLGLALISLVNCSSSDDSTPPVPPGGGAALRGPMVFVNNRGDSSLTSVSLKGDSGNAVLDTIPAAKFEGVALGDMQFSTGNWFFVNLTAANKVATIDPLTGATPVHEVNLPAGTRPVHLYRDRNDGEVIWIMNDGDRASGTSTPGDDLVNCAAQGGGSVTALHNSHPGPGATPPRVLGTTCLLADGHKVAAFSDVPKRVFVSSGNAGEIAVIDDDEASANYRKMINRIDLCKSAKETAPCNNESATPLTTAFTPNSSSPHGIRWSNLTKKIYSVQEGYREIAEIDPATLAITKTFDLTGTPYTGYGISPDGRFLLLRGATTAPTATQATKLGVIDLSLTTPVRTDFTIAELDGTSPGAFKFSPDGKRFYILAGNTATSTKKDRLFAFDSSTLTATTPALTLLREIPLVVTGGHGFDVLVQGAGEAKYIVVSNSTDNSVSIINASDNQEKQKVTVGPTPGSVIVYFSGAATGGNQATASLTGASKAQTSVLPDQLDDHGMPE